MHHSGICWNGLAGLAGLAALAFQDLGTWCYLEHQSCGLLGIHLLEVVIWRAGIGVLISVMFLWLL